MTTAATPMPGPFHEGEIALQSSVGMAERIGEVARRVVRDHMPEQHRDFFARLPFLAMATVDDQGDVWPTLVAGEPGFLQSPDPRRLVVGARPYPGDPARVAAPPGDAVGLLGIELSSRRRNRLNGTVETADKDSFTLSVGHSFGNCPQYIQLRDLSFARDPRREPEAPPRWTEALDSRAVAMIEAADTFFVGSYVDTATERQVDVSHRGGKPGFVRIDADGGLTIPDFAGNFHFNTLGNFLVNPKAGLLFVDFETGDILQLTGEAEVITDSPEIAAFRGAERIWKFRPTRLVDRPGALPLRFALRDGGFSPNSLMTGSWPEAERTLAAREMARTWREMLIERIVEEAGDIRSFYLAPADGLGMAGYLAGQHLPVRARIDGSGECARRVYTLSSAPSDDFLRISVRRQGAFSNWLHARTVGDLLEARAPLGAFRMSGDEGRAAVLIAAGVGITPMLSMLRQIVFEGRRRRRTRPTWLVHAARSREERAFHAEIAELVAQADGAVRFVAVHSAPASGEREGVDYSWQGRFAATDLARFLPFGDYDFYLCGPQGFMQSSYDGLRAMGVSDDRVHAEAFGPSSLERDGEAQAPHAAPAASESVTVAFTASGKEARWEPGSGTLLELAEARGLAPEFSCRSGTCGTCAVRLARGTVTYPGGIAASSGKHEVLLCSAMPAEGTEPLEIEA